MKLYFYKKNGITTPISGPVLIPANEDVVESLNSIKGGTYLSADIKSPRNGLFHDKFMKMLRFVVENCDLYPNVETLLHELKLWLGLYTLKVLPSGKPIYDPGSISFAKMGNDAFAKFVSQSVDGIMLHVFTQIEDPEERDRLTNILLSFV